MLTLDPQSSIRLVNVPFDSDGKHNLYFANKTAQMDYFSNLPGYTVDNSSYVKKEGSIRPGINYELIKDYNYLYYKNYQATITDQGLTKEPIDVFCYIIKMEYINENVTKIYFKTDSFQTYLFDILSDTNTISYINKQHVKKSDDIIGKHLLDEGLQGSEYVRSAKLDESTWANSTITWDAKVQEQDKSIFLPQNDYMIVCGCTKPFLDLTDITKSRSRMYGGIYSGLTYYGFANEVQCSIFIDYLNQSAAIDGLYNMFIAPQKIGNWYGTYESKTIYTDEETLTGGTTYTIGFFRFNSETYKTLDTLSCSLPTEFSYAGTTVIGTGYKPHNNKLYTAPFCQIQLQNNNGGVANYNYEYFNTKNNCQFKIIGTLSQGCSIIAYPLNYKGTSENFNEVLDMVKFPTCSWNTDSYTNWLTQTAVSRANRERYAKEDKDISFIKSATQAAFSIADGNVGGLVNAGFSAVQANMNYDRTIDSLNEEKYRASLVPPSINNAIASPEVLYAVGKYKYEAWALTIHGDRAKEIDQYFDRFGYTVNKNANIVQAIKSRSKWNYVKTAECNIQANIPDENANEIKNLFNEGITIWKNPNEIYRYDLGAQNV